MSRERIGERVSLSRAAIELGVGYLVARDRVCRGQLVGGQTPDGKWWVDRGSLERAVREKQKAGAEAVPA